MTDTIHLLLVEDNMGDADLVKEYLYGNCFDTKFNITHVTSIHEAVVSAKNIFDIILMDLGLPDVTGTEGMEVLARLYPNTPIVVLTGLNDSDTAKEALEKGAQDYIIKGNVDCDSLVRIILFSIERYKLTEKLILNNRNIETLIENLVDGIIMFDQNNDLYLINSKARYLLSFYQNQTINVRDFDLKFPEIKLTKNIDKLRFDPDSTVITEEVEINKEVKSIIQCLILPVKYMGKIIGICLSLQDITKKKEHESLKSQFISVVSHELRTPLSSIKTAVDILGKGNAGPTNEKQDKFISIAVNNINRLKCIVDDLLDISKIEACKMVLDLDECYLKDSINSVLEAVAETAKQKSIHLKSNISSDLPAIYADSDKLIQILFNLIGNALKFTSDNGEICVSAKNMHPAPYLEITVSDNGIGISGDQILIVFDKFQQTDSSLKRKIKGTGLGLSIAKNLIEMHNGSIRVESKINVGSRFIFTIPVYSQRSILKNYLASEIRKAKEQRIAITLIFIKIEHLSKESAPFVSIKRVVANTLRRQNDRVFSYSKREYKLAVVVEATKNDAYVLCKRIKDALNKSLNTSTSTFKMSISEYPKDSKDADSLLVNAIKGVENL